MFEKKYDRLVSFQRLIVRLTVHSGSESDFKNVVKTNVSLPLMATLVAAALTVRPVTPGR